MLKYWRVWLLIVMLLASIFAIGLKAFPYGREGVEVIYVSSGSPALDLIQVGDIITSFNGEPVKSLEEWNQKSSGITGPVKLTANNKNIDLNVTNSLGINVIDIERTNIDFGIDMKGGTRIILKPQGNVTEDLLDQTIGVLETRANLFGLQEMQLFPIKTIDGDFFIQIEAAGVGSEVIEELLSRQGRFEGKIVKPLEVSNGTVVMKLGEKQFPIIILEDGVEIGGEFFGKNETFVLKGLDFEYLNTTEGQALFMATVFRGEDIELVYTDPQRSGVMPQGDAYQFFFTLLLSADGANSFAEVTEGIPKYFDINSGDEYIESPLLLLIDDEIVSSLRVAGDLAGKIVQNPQVTGVEPTQEGASEEKLRLQTILKSGALPVVLETQSVDIISPTLGSSFFDAALLAALVAAGVVFVIVFIRYRRIKISAPLVAIGISEVIIILGIASTNDIGIWIVVLLVNLALIGLAWFKKHEIDIYAWAGAILIPMIGMASWTIDLPAIAGIIAAIGSGVDHQIIIADEALRGEKKAYGVKEQIKRAFFIIMGAAATTIFAMLPLMFVGVGLVRGFAVTTIVGVLVGVLITRPAYAKIVERFT